MVPVVVVPAFWGEEFGWRSYLQQRVSRRPVMAAVISGIIWSLWHYPLVYTDYTDYSSPREWQYPNRVSTDFAGGYIRASMDVQNAMSGMTALGRVATAGDIGPGCRPGRPSNELDHRRAYRGQRRFRL